MRQGAGQPQGLSLGAGKAPLQLFARQLDADAGRLQALLQGNEIRGGCKGLVHRTCGNPLFQGGSVLPANRLGIVVPPDGLVGP